MVKVALLESPKLLKVTNYAKNSGNKAKYKCPSCLRPFKTRDALKRHLIKKHSITNGKETGRLELDKK